MNPTAERSNRNDAGFTLTELLAVIGIIAVLSAMLLPAMGGTKSQSRIVTCAANFRQWAVAVNLYAKDNQEWLPGANGVVAGGGMYVWEVPTNMCHLLGGYGVDVPKWFCPSRPSEMDVANGWATSNYGHAISTLDELKDYFLRNYPDTLFANHNWWVPRSQGTTSFPADLTRAPLIAPWLKESLSTQYGWPRKLHDNAAAHVPFISDKCGSGNDPSTGLGTPLSGSAGHTIADISPNTAHFFGGKFANLNAAYADGHVETRGPNQTKCAYVAAIGSTFWFY